MLHDSTHDQEYHDAEEHVDDPELTALDDNPLNPILGLGVLLIIFNLTRSEEHTSELQSQR